MAIELTAAVALAALASVLACRLVMAAGISDPPDLARKAHRAPTPTSGGLGASFGFALALAVLCLMPAADWSAGITPAQSARMSAAAVFAFCFLALGLYDDARPLGARTKFAIFTAMALLAPFIVGAPERIVLGDGLSVGLYAVVGALGAALWIFVLVNAVNFLDGANGLAMGSTAIGLVGLALVSLYAGAEHAAALALCAGGALIGFLVWNFPNGRLFAGDAGALFAGALAALASLLAIHDGGVSVFIPPLLFFPLLADALLTLRWRVGRRPHLLEGHRDHMFQVALRAGWTHRRVALIYWAMTGACAAFAVMSELIAEGDWLPFAWRGAWVEHALSYAPFAAFVLAAIMSLAVSKRVRAFAAARNLTDP